MSKWDRIADATEALATRFDGILARLDADFVYHGARNVSVPHIAEHGVTPTGFTKKETATGNLSAYFTESKSIAKGYGTNLYRTKLGQLPSDRENLTHTPGDPAIWRTRNSVAPENLERLVGKKWERVK